MVRQRQRAAHASSQSSFKVMTRVLSLELALIQKYICSGWAHISWVRYVCVCASKWMWCEWFFGELFTISLFIEMRNVCTHKRTLAENRCAAICNFNRRKSVPCVLNVNCDPNVGWQPNKTARDYSLCFYCLFIKTHTEQLGLVRYAMLGKSFLLFCLHTDRTQAIRAGNRLINHWNWSNGKIIDNKMTPCVVFPLWMCVGWWKRTHSSFQMNAIKPNYRNMDCLNGNEQ